MGVIEVDFSLNFVWIEATRLDVPETINAVTCPVPSELMANVEKIAAHNPDLTISLWVDIYGIGGHPERIIDAMNEPLEEPNVTIKPLDSIPSYTVNPLFRRKSVTLTNSHDPIWQQVDLARLFVLKHCLITEDKDAAIYSDMDRNLTKDFFVRAKSLDEAQEILAREGIVIGKEDGCHIENQFIGIAQSQMQFLTEVLIPKTIGSISGGLNGWEGHVTAIKSLDSSKRVFMPVPTFDPDKQVKIDYISKRESTISDMRALPA